MLVFAVFIQLFLLTASNTVDDQNQVIGNAGGWDHVMSKLKQQGIDKHDPALADRIGIIMFSSEVIRKIGYYVYLLTDPITNEIFYVGKGKGNRVFSHLKDQNNNPKTRPLLLNALPTSSGEATLNAI